MATRFRTAGVDEGADAGMERAEKNGVDVPSRDAMEPFLDRVNSVIEDWPGSEQFNTRFTALYVETVTVAAVSRRAYDHRQLDEEDLKAFLGIFEWLLNSWVHLHAPSA